MKKKKAKTVSRSAITGRFVRESTAKRHPNMTVRQPVKKKKRGVWIEFTESGKVADVLHEPKSARLPKPFVWCEEVTQ